MCEDLEKQVKDSHKSLEDALDKIIEMEKDIEKQSNELEDVRTRIT